MHKRCRFVDSQESDDEDIDLKQNSNDPLTDLPYSSSRAHQSSNIASNNNQSNNNQSNRHRSNSRSYSRPSHHIVYNLRSIEKKRKIETATTIIRNMIDHTKYKLESKCLQDALTIAGNTIAMGIPQISSINVLISNLNKVINYNHYQIEPFPLVSGPFIASETFTIFSNHHNKVQKVSDTLMIIEHFSALLQYIFLVSIGQRHRDERISRETPLTKFVANGSSLYMKLNGIMNFGQYVRKYNGLFWLRLKSSGYSRQVKPIYELLKLDGFYLMMDGQNNGLNDWDEDSKTLFLQLLHANYA
eukprot:185845_1